MTYFILRPSFLILFAFLLIQTNSVFAEVRSLNHQNSKRIFWLDETVINKSDKPKPLLVHLHGFRSTETAEKGKQTLDYIIWDSLKKIASDNNFIVIQPAALSGQWRLFPNLKNVYLDNGQEVDDVDFIFKLVKKLVEEGIADPNRVYLSGISDGAIMSYHLLCQKNSPFVAAVTIVGTMYEKHLDDCKPDYTPPLMLIAGTNDLILPYDGWLFKTGREVSVPETLEFWRKRHGCTGQKSKLLDDADPQDNSRIRLVEWTNCQKDGAVKLLRAEGGGHAVPDFNPVSDNWLKRSGGQNRDISSAEEVWKFLQVFSLNN